MDANGWYLAASLLRHWLDSTGTKDTTSVTMDWALTSRTVQAQYKLIYAWKIFANDKARGLIADTLAGQPAGEYTDVYCNSRPIRIPKINYVFGLDSFDAAIHNCNLHVHVKVDLSEKIRGYQYVTIKEVGVSLADDYEFRGNQRLGYWNKNTNYVGMHRLLGTPIYNKTFRDYTAKTGIGKDFLIESDIMWTVLPKTQRFRIR